MKKSSISNLCQNLQAFIASDTVGVQEQVGRLDVSVADALGVQVAQGGQQLAGVGQGQVFRHGAFFLQQVVQSLQVELGILGSVAINGQHLNQGQICMYAFTSLYVFEYGYE
jgi:molybdopterin biosynthesis enzyme